MTMKMNDFLAGQSRAVIVTLGFMAVLVIGLADYLTGHKIAPSIFYILPIFAVSWYAGKRAGIATALFSAATLLTIELLLRQNYPHSIVPHLNYIARVSVFLGFVFLVAAAKRKHEELEEEVAEKTASLVTIIEEHERAEEKIEQQKAFLEKIIESLAHPFYVIDAHDYTIKLANSASGLRGGTGGNTCYALTHRQDRPCNETDSLCPLEMVKKTKKFVTVEHTHYDAAGNPRSYEVHASPILDADGNVVQMIEYSLDITERKRAEEQLRETNDTLRQLIETSPLAIIMLDRASHVSLWSPAAERLFGWSAAEVLGRPLSIIPADQQELFQAFFARQLEGETFTALELSRLRKDGLLVDVNLWQAPLKDAGGAIIGTVGILADNSEHKQAEMKIEILNTNLAARAAELENANRELEAFNYTVSHDLRKPLTVINGYCQAILELYGGGLDDPCQDYLREIYDGTLRMNGLIDTLLGFSHLTHVELHPETVDLSGMAREVAAELMMNEPERRVTFRIAEGLEGNGDAGLLRVALGNLIGNAWKYTGTREEGEIEFGIREMAEQPVWFVRDNGIGFDMEHAAKLFIPFQRLPGAGGFEGHGIGLATVRRIIERHGGKIWAAGEAGKGATFYFTLAG